MEQIARLAEVTERMTAARGEDLTPIEAEAIFESAKPLSPEQIKSGWRRAEKGKPIVFK